MAKRVTIMIDEDLDKKNHFVKPNEFSKNKLLVASLRS